MAKSGTLKIYEAEPLIPSNAYVTGPKALIYAQEIQRLRDKYGTLNYELIVAEAKKPGSPLHDWPGWKGWDKTLASEAYWRGAARRLVAEIHIRFLDDPRQDRGPVRALVRIVRDDGEAEIDGLSVVLRSEMYLKQLLKRELDIIRGCKRRLRDYQELSVVVGHLDAAIEAAEVVLHKTKLKKPKKGKS